MLKRYLESSFEANVAVTAFKNVPRFGSTDEITDIFEDGFTVNRDQVVDYARGLVFLPALFIAALILWIISLLVAKCLRAGIMAGNPIFEDNSAYRKMRFSRLLAAISSLTIAIMGIVFLVKGAESAKSVFNDVRDAADGLAKITDDVVDTLSRTIDLGEDAVPFKDSLIEMIQNDICDSTDPTFADDQNAINTAARSLLETLTVLEDFSTGELTNLRSDFDDTFSDLYREIDAYVDDGESYSQPVYAAAPIIAIGIIFFVGAFISWRASTNSGNACSKSYFIFQTWVCLPLFFIIIIVAAIIAAVSGAVLTVNSDLCLGGTTSNPEGTVQVMATKSNLNADGLEIINYYIINSCDGTFTGLDTVDDLITDLSASVEDLEDLNKLLVDDSIDVQGKCNIDPNNYDELVYGIGNVTESFYELKNITADAKDAIACDKVNAVFVDLFHDALCDSFPMTLYWIFWTMTVVYALGMMIFLLRGALLPTEYDQVENGYNNEPDPSAPPPQDQNFDDDEMPKAVAY